jgi:hypothetical protein
MGLTVILSTKLQQNKGVEVLVFAAEVWPEVNMCGEESMQASTNGKGVYLFFVQFAPIKRQNNSV